MSSNTCPSNSRSRKSRILKSRIVFVAFTALVLLALATTSAFMANFPGAIYTSDSSCQKVNLNTFDTKDAVYLNGGPQGGGAGLPEGYYCVRVTTPDGTVLGTSAPGAAHVNGLGAFDSCYQLSAILTKESNGSPGYDDTDNSGGVYKVLVSPDCDFDPSNRKEDNFKVRSIVQPPQGTLKVVKFYDANANGTLDIGTDTPILGWQVLVGEQQNFSLINQQLPTEVNLSVDEGCYTAQEADAAGWLHTGAIIKSTAVTSLVPGEIDFGNVCLGPGGGMTLGFWSNKNGQALVDGADLAALGVLNLRDAAGNHWPGANPAAPTYAQYRTWLLNANAANMAYMLSAQLSAMKLNVLNGKVLGGAVVYAPGTGLNGNDFGTITQLIAAADAELGLHGNTTSGTPGDAFRAYQEALKNALDKANNNLNFVQTAAQCGVGAGGILTSPPAFSFTAGTTAPACP